MLLPVLSPRTLTSAACQAMPKLHSTLGDVQSLVVSEPETTRGLPLRSTTVIRRAFVLDKCPEARVFMFASKLRKNDVSLARREDELRIFGRVVECRCTKGFRRKRVFHSQASNESTAGRFETRAARRSCVRNE